AGLFAAPSTFQGTMPGMQSGINLSGFQGQTGLSGGQVVQPTPPTTNNQTKAMDDLDMLGKAMMQKSMPAEGKITQPVPAPKVPLNQMRINPPPVNTVDPLPRTNLVNPMPVPNTTSAPPSLMDPSKPLNAGLIATVSTTPATNPGSVMATGGLPKPPTPTISSPGVASPTKITTEIKALTDVFVALETIQPGTADPVQVYDKNNLKIVLHIGKDTCRPRPDVIVMVVTTISTNAVPIKGLTFQAAVPKSMKVKLQPPSATDLPAYSPILPPAAITQVMLLANPNKEKVRLKYKLLYKLDEQQVTDVGDVEGFTVQ
ncbi:unnamed protein product, partial [Owenia fusiformis]